MEQFFWRIMDLSISGSIAILEVFAFRYLLKNQEKIFSYLLWIIVGIRLLIPVSFCGIWSWVFPFLRGQNEKNGEMAYNVFGLIRGSNKLSAVMAEPPGNETKQFLAAGNFMEILFGVWLTGALILFMKSVVTYFLLKRKVQPSIRQKGYDLSDNISGRLS